MASTWEADTLVTAKSGNVDRYKRNFLRQAVCEMRFPTLMELGGSKPPVRFVNALRRDYPHLELGNELTIGVGTNPTGAHMHIFRSSKLTWTVSLKQSAVSVETVAYSEYAELKERVLKVVDAASNVIDSDFYTRIGIRYINVVSAGQDDPVAKNWINPALTSPLLANAFTGVAEYAGKLQLMAKDGGCLLQHALQLRPSTRSGEPVAPDYVLDVDVFRNEVPVDDVAAALDSIHSQAFDVFDWALDAPAREYLSGDVSRSKG
ncbi:TIGR04255 family protein [Trinickia sp.]|uniref:TIGR04255 family protein n=1 Tax=Trinickia sp. TaxID=2571163 RepID=UPI003F810F80